MTCPRSVSVRRMGRHQIGEGQEVFHPEARASTAHAEVRIGRNEIGPTDGHRAPASIGVGDGDAILTPELLGDYERERLPSQRVERVGDADVWWINLIRCS